MNKDTGGPAFPRSDAGYSPTQDGMTLRDWFAGQALAGLSFSIGDQLLLDLANGTRGGKFIITAAYVLADAMIEQRGKE